MEYLKKFKKFKKQLNEEVEYEVTPEGHKIPLTTELFEFIDANTYETMLDLRYIFDDEEFSEEEIEKRLDEVDKKEYGKIIVNKVQEIYNEYVDPELKSYFGDLYVKGKMVKFDSPSYYNYRGDEVYVDIYFTDYVKAYEFFMEHIEENNLSGYFDRWLKETYKSAPGFISHTPNTLEKLKTAFEGGEVVYVMAAILNYVLFEIQKFDVEEVQNEFVSRVISEAVSSL